MGWDGPLTHRQYLVWQVWLANEWNRPNRTDHYLMQIAFYILRSNAKYPGRVTMQDQKIEFIIGGSPPKKPDTDTIAASAKAAWTRRMTMPIVTDRNPALDEH